MKIGKAGVKKCADCSYPFKPEKEYYKLCSLCFLRHYRISQDKCPDCGYKIKGWADQYFIKSCLCIDLKLMEGHYDDEEYR